MVRFMSKSKLDVTQTSGYNFLFAYVSIGQQNELIQSVAKPGFWCVSTIFRPVKSSVAEEAVGRLSEKRLQPDASDLCGFLFFVFLIALLILGSGFYDLIRPRRLFKQYNLRNPS